MPRLSDRPTNAELGVIALIDLYRKERDFERQFQQICRTYRPAILHFIVQWLASHREAVPISKDKYAALISTLRKGVGNAKDLNPDACVLDLDSLAWRNKLRLPRPLAGFMLFMEAVTQEVKSLGIKVQEGSAFHPHSEVEPLTLKVYDWQIKEYGQNKTIEQVRRAVAEYTTRLLATGLSDYPSSLKKHAEWWFKHYVHGEKYDDIAQDEAYDSDGGSLISYARNVGAAVRKFGKSVGIDPKDTK